ncbi:hypothetical protein ACFV0W_00590 [Streptomyces anulatus]
MTGAVGNDVNEEEDDLDGQLSFDDQDEPDSGDGTPNVDPSKG